NEILDHVPEGCECAFCARDGGGFQDLSISSDALDSRITLFRAERGDIDAVRKGLASKREIAHGILANVRVAECIHEPGVAAGASQIENLSLDPAGHAFAETCRTREQDQQIGTTGLDGFHNRTGVDQRAVERTPAINADEAVV